MKARVIGISSVLISFFLVVALMMVVSCSSKPGDALLGKWEDKKSKESMEFLKDGTVVMLPSHQSAKFSVVDKGRIKMEFGGKAVIFDYILKGDELSLKMKGAPDGNFQRVK